MTEQDWLDDIFDKPSSDLTEEARRKQDLLKSVLIDRQASPKGSSNEPLPWDDQQLAEQKEALFGRLFGDDRQTLVDQPKLTTTQPAVKPQPGKLTQLTRYFVPMAMAASVAVVALNFIPLGLSPDYDNTPFHELLANNNLPLYNDRSLLAGWSSSKAATTEPGEQTPPSFSVTASSPNRLSFQLIEYLNKHRLPYQFSQSSGEHQLQMLLYAPHTAEINAFLKAQGATELADGDSLLLIKPEK